MTTQICIGVGGWTFEPWRGVFYPGDLKQKDDPEFTAPAKPRDVFAFIIHEGKVRAPHGAMALQTRVD